MIKKEIAEIKRQFTPANCSISRICGCYVDGEKNKKAEFKEAFLSLPEEDMFKYFELLRKNLSGTLGKNLINLEFPLAAEEEGGPHEFLLKLRGSRLQDDALLDAFYDRIIENYDYVGNYRRDASGWIRYHSCFRDHGNPLSGNRYQGSAATQYCMRSLRSL